MMLKKLADARAENFAALAGQKTGESKEGIQYRSTQSLPGFDQSYFTEEAGGGKKTFAARIVGLTSAATAGTLLDSIMQQYSRCLRGFTFYKDANCQQACTYYVTVNNSQEVVFYAGYTQAEAPDEYAILLQMPAARTILPGGLQQLLQTKPPLQIPEGNLTVCQVMDLYLAAAGNQYQDLLLPDGSLRVAYPEALSSGILSDGTLRVVLATQTGDEATELDEVYFITRKNLEPCLKTWNLLELTREDDADFLNDLQWIKGSRSVQLRYEISKGGKGLNLLVLEIQGS